MEVEEKNEQIAIMLGWKICDCDPNLPKHYKYGSRGYECVDVKNMKFHSDWNQLMRVVDFILKTCGPFEGRWPYSYLKLESLKMGTKIEVVHRHASEFAAWYNTSAVNK